MMRSTPFAAGCGRHEGAEDQIGRKFPKGLVKVFPQQQWIDVLSRYAM